MLRFLTFIFIFSFALNSYSHTILTKQIPKHVIIIGIDGLGGVFLKEYYDSKYAVNPSNFKVLESQSLYTYYMRNEDPTGSGPNWASMVTGVSPNVHKIKSNADLITADQILDKIEKNIEKSYIKKILKEKGPYKQFKQKVRKSNKIFKVYKKLNYNLEKQQKKQDSLGIKEAPETFNLENIFKELRKTYSEFSDLFKKKYTPTFFDYVKENDPDRQIRVYHEWPLFKQLLNKENIDKLFHEEYSDAVLEEALADLKHNDKPSLSFVHLDALDHIGHSKRWGTKSYYKGVAEMDILLGHVLDAINSSPKLKGNTVLILSADHGGERNKRILWIDRGNHDDPDATSVRFIPWFAMGPGIEAQEIQYDDVNIKNMAPSVLSILDVPQPNNPGWEGNIPLL